MHDYSIIFLVLNTVLTSDTLYVLMIYNPMVLVMSRGSQIIANYNQKQTVRLPSISPPPPAAFYTLVSFASLILLVTPLFQKITNNKKGCAILGYNSNESI